MLFPTFLISGIVLDEVTERYSRFYRVDEENMETFERCCEAFDYLIDAAGLQECDLEISVDEDDLTVSMALTLPSTIIADDSAAKYGWISDWALSMETARVENDRVRAHFVFPSLWEEII